MRIRAGEGGGFFYVPGADEDRHRLATAVPEALGQFFHCCIEIDQDAAVGFFAYALFEILDLYPFGLVAAFRELSQCRVALPFREHDEDHRLRLIERHERFIGRIEEIA